jgi:hypothetical protein
MQVAFFCAIFGALLGWLQIRAEKHPDLWAFLVHRPITRTTIFWSKVFSGLLLYVVATGVPLFGFVIVVSIPGKVAAPFQWAMALPLVAIFLSGMVFYFAGLLTGLRKARWYASRGFGLGMAIVSSFGIFIVQEFWQALLIIAGAGVFLAMAVWGSFQTGGYNRAQPALGKVALTAASLVSVTVLIGVVFSLVGNLLMGRREYSYSHYQMTKDGTIVKVTQHHTGDAADDPEVVDLSGRPVLDEKTGQKLKPKDLQQRYAMGMSAHMNLDDAPRKQNRYRNRYSDTPRFFSPRRVLDKSIWYLMADGRLVAYHGITRRWVGTLAPQGSSGAPDDTRFLRPNDYEWSNLREYTQPEVLASAKTAYLVNLENRELKPLFTVTNGDAIGGFAEGSWPHAGMTKNYALILTRASIRLMDLESNTLVHLPYEPSPPAYPTVSVLQLDPTNTFAVRFEPDYFANKKSGGKLLSRAEWVNADGSIAKTIDLPKLPEPQSSATAERMFIPFLPPGFPLFTWEEPYRMWQVLRIVPALLCAFVGWWLGRRNNFSLKAKAGWGIFHLLFGVPGLLAFLAVQEWPAKEPCPNCKKLRVVNREQCEHCGSNFAPPDRTGTEIFEPLTAG